MSGTDAKIKLYISSVSSSIEIKKQQRDIAFKLSAKKIPFEEIDVSQDENLKVMREKMDKADALAPQLFNEDTYLGDYAAFDMAVEDEVLDQFLKL